MAGQIELRARANVRYAYSGRSILVTNLDGVITDQGTEGFYVHNTRLLSRLEYTANGRPLTAVDASPVDGRGYLAHTEIPESDDVPKGSVYGEMAYFVGDGMRWQIRIENYHSSKPARFTFGIRLAADFADSDEAEQGQRQQQAPVETNWDDGAREAVFRYQHPELDRAVAVRVDQAPVPAYFCSIGSCSIRRGRAGSACAKRLLQLALSWPTEW